MLDYTVFSDKGERQINEDTVGVLKKEDTFYFFLADGLGGHGLGNIASGFAVDELKAYFQHTDVLEEGIIHVQEVLLKEQKKQGYRGEMKTTVTLLSIAQSAVRYSHVGDSRIYHFHRGKLKDRTLDHSVCQRLVEARLIREKDIRNHPDRSKLLKALGEPWGDYKVEVREQVYDASDAYLLCSDGFWEHITEKEMQKCLKKSKNTKDWIDRMVAIILRNGRGTNMDNFSCIGVML